MKKSLYQEIEIPEGIEVKLDGNELSVKGAEGEIKKTFNFGKIDFELKDNKIVIGNKKSTKVEKKIMNTFAAHVKNMIKGVQGKFEYKLKICFSHFPFTVEVKEGEAVIKNFLGEKIPRKVKIPEGANVKIDGQTIRITSIEKEIAGQTAANFETATKIRNRDLRVFQDGIYIINKAGKEI
jgi:large subunit ribosomal protein L6